MAPPPEQLREMRRLLSQQMTIVNDRTAKANDILAGRTAVKVVRTPAETAVLRATRSGMLTRARRSTPPTQHLSKPAVVAEGSKIAAIRDKALQRHLATTTLRAARRRPAPGAKPPGAPQARGAAAAAAPRKAKVPTTLFPVRYQRGELPCAIEHRASGNSLTWVCSLQNLDYEHYLPLFLDGIRCKDQPYKFMARQGAHELIEAARGRPECILPHMASIVTALRNALVTHVPDNVLAALHILGELVASSYGVGEALVPYYRQILAVLNLFFTKRASTGDGVDFGQWKNEDISSAVLDTLELLEQTGGPNAYRNIKYMVPTYESCMT